MDTQDESQISNAKKFNCRACIFRHSSQFYRVFVGFFITMVMAGIVWMFSTLSVIGVNALDNQVHLSQFTSSMASIFLNLAPIVMYAYIAYNYISSLYYTFKDEIRDFFQFIKSFAKGGFKELQKVDETN